MSEQYNKWWKISIVVLSFCIVGLGFMFKNNLDSVLYKKHLDNGVPRIDIKLNGVSLEEIGNGSKETRYEGNDLTVYDDGEVQEFSGVEIKGRGNSTWEKDKRPYQIKLKNKASLLGMEKAKKWILLANHYDYSSLRNDISFMLAEMLDIEFNNRGKFVELYFDGKYEGLYYLIQKIEIVKGSVDLREEGGILFELDNLHRYEEKCYESYLDDCLILKDIVFYEGSEEEAVNNFLTEFNKFENAAKEGDYGTVSEIIDIDSFAKYFLINEFTVNPDAYSSSFYLYKDGANGKIHAGPVWDFDLALANHRWGWEIDETFFSPYEDMVREREAFGEGNLKEDTKISKIFYYLMKIPEFKERVEDIFKDRMLGRGEEFIEAINSKKNEIYKAILTDNKRWGREGFEAEFTDMIDWIKARYEHFEKKYGNKMEEVIDQRYYQFL